MSQITANPEADGNVRARAVPAAFILTTLFVGPFARWLAGFRRHFGLIEEMFGGLLISTNSMNYIAQWMHKVGPEQGPFLRP